MGNEWRHVRNSHITFNDVHKYRFMGHYRCL